MGQRKIFEDIRGVPKTPEEEQKLIAALKQTIGFIRRFRAGFRDMFSSYQEIRSIPNGIPPEFHEEYRRMQKAEIHLQSVSDAVIAWTPVHTVDEPALAKAMNSIWGMLVATAGMTLISLGVKHVIRGGIDLDGGITIEAGGAEIYGRALNCAYELESQVAKYPRIVVGEGLLKFLDEIQNIGGNSRFVGHAKGMATRCKALIIKDTDGQHIIHYLGLSSKQVMELQGAEKFRKDILDPAAIFVADSAAKFKDDEKLGPRYAQLKQYFDRYLPEWQS